MRRQDLRGSWRRILLVGLGVHRPASLGAQREWPDSGTGTSSSTAPASGNQHAAVSSGPILRRRFMGKGDKKTRRGKINRASYGKNRKRKVKKKAKTSSRAA